MEREKGFLKGLATTLNAGGSALVTLYDAGAIIVGKSAHYVKKTAPQLPNTAKNILKSGAVAILPGEKGKLEGRIRELEGKIKKLHYEIGAESSKYAGEGRALDTVIVKSLISRVKEYEGVIDTMKTRLAELEGKKKAEEEREKALKALEALKTILGSDREFGITASEKALGEELDRLKKRWKDRTIPVVKAPAEEAASVEEPEKTTIQVQAEEEIREAAIKEETVAPEKNSSGEMEEKLNNMLKSDLIKICRNKGIVIDQKLTKWELIKLILESGKL